MAPKMRSCALGTILANTYFLTPFRVVSGFLGNLTYVLSFIVQFSNHWKFLHLQHCQSPRAVA